MASDITPAGTAINAAENLIVITGKNFVVVVWIDRNFGNRDRATGAGALEYRKQIWVDRGALCDVAGPVPRRREFVASAPALCSTRVGLCCATRTLNLMGYFMISVQERLRT